MTRTTSRGAPGPMAHRGAVRSAAGIAVAAVLALAACGDGDTPDGAAGSPTATSTETARPAPSPTASPSPTGSASPTVAPGDTSGDGEDDAPPFPANTEPDTGQGSGEPAGTLVDLRVGGHDGFDRVVFELAGTATPSWHVRYVDEAVQDASGLPVEVDGDAVLEVTLFSVAIPEPGEPFYEGPHEIRVAGTEQVEEVVFASLFEGYLQAFIGVDDGEQPFRAFALEGPPRVVVEVRHAR